MCVIRAGIDNDDNMSNNDISTVEDVIFVKKSWLSFNIKGGLTMPYNPYN